MPRIRKVYVWYILILTHLGAFYYQLSGKRYMLKDSEEYVLAAENIFQQGVLYCGIWEEPYRKDFFTKRPPIYPIVIGLTGGYLGTPWILLLGQNILSLFNLWLALRMGQLLLKRSGKTTDPTKLPLLLVILLWLYPAQWIYANLVMTEILFQSFLTLGLYALLRSWEEMSLRYLGLYTGMLLLAMFTKPVLYLFAIPHLMGVLWMAYSWKKSHLLILALLPLMAIGGYQKWNKHRTGYAHFSSIQNLSLFQYTAYNLLGQEYGLERAAAMNDSVLEVMFTLPEYASQQRLIGSYSRDIVLSHPLPYAVMHLKGMVNFLFDPGRFELYHFFGIEEVGGKGLQRTFSEEGYAGIWEYIKNQPIGIWLLLGLILVGNLARWGIAVWVLIKGSLPLASRVILGVFILYLVGITGTSGASRFAVPLFPVTLSLVYMWLGNKPSE